MELTADQRRQTQTFTGQLPGEICLSFSEKPFMFALSTDVRPKGLIPELNL
jgi:hypothetical protein